VAEPLARAGAAVLTDPRLFGGGAPSAELRRRAETVAHGYLAVVDEYCCPTTGIPWCTFTISLPTVVPTLTIEHRQALGRPGVPAPGADLGPFGDDLFDRLYLAVAPDAEAALPLITPALRKTLIAYGVMRVSFSGSTLMLRTVDCTRATDEALEWLQDAATLVLESSPAFVTVRGEHRPFPPGYYGPNGAQPSPGRSLRRFGRRG